MDTKKVMSNNSKHNLKIARKVFEKGDLTKTEEKVREIISKVPAYANSLFLDIGKNKWNLKPKDPVLIETIQRHPKVFAGYNI